MFCLSTNLLMLSIVLDGVNVEELKKTLYFSKKILQDKKIGYNKFSVSCEGIVEV